MKNELILSTLLLTSQITPTAMASVQSHYRISDSEKVVTFKSSLLKINHPFKEEVLELYALITVEKSDQQMNDLNLGKITQFITIRLFDKNNEEIKDFKINDSEEGGFYAELRGAKKGDRAYTLWTCSSTMNCGFYTPGFLHSYYSESAKSFSHTLQVPVLSYENNAFRYESILLRFDSSDRLVK